VRSFIEGRAMGSVEYSPLRLAAKWIGRNKKEVGAVLLVLLAVAGGILGTIWYLRKLDQDKILGLSEDANVMLAEWKPLAEEGEFEAAELKIDEAKNLFQMVLAVDENDESAILGLQHVNEAAAHVRQQRAEAITRERLKSQVSRLLNEARGAIEAGKRDSLFGYREFEKAYAKADAVLALEPSNKDALLLKATAANELAIAAREVPRWEVMKLWIDRLQATGELKPDLQERINEYNRGR
jgi:hypothetical protein